MLTFPPLAHMVDAMWREGLCQQVRRGMCTGVINIFSLILSFVFPYTVG